jgi:hypothetical protein
MLEYHVISPVLYIYIFCALSVNSVLSTFIVLYYRFLVSLEQG